MDTKTEYFRNSSLSLADMLGEEYIDSVCRAQAAFGEKSIDELQQLAHKKVNFYPLSYQDRLKSLIPHIGSQILDPPIPVNEEGCSTESFNASFSRQQAPLAGKGYFKITESGKLQAITKSEHYHAPLGHDFPGYKLIEIAKELGISNITHNNTRGFITRIVEKALIQIANGYYGSEEAFSTFIYDAPEDAMTRVINLQTGSLAVEAGLKMMLARFYVSDPGMGITPEYDGKVPVFIVMADYENGKQANYHGTTILTQTMRDLWPGLYGKFEEANAYKVVAAPINDIETFRDLVEKYHCGNYRVAGFFHELILMNYGGIKIDRDYLQQAHAVCRENGIPTMVDEIQSCLWAPDLFLYREYGLKPDFVSVGKGFPGGQYAASKILLSSRMDNLNQFGALVTNGQEELSSLAYLITITFAFENRDITRKIGEYYESGLRKLASRHHGIIKKIEGLRHLSAIVFESAETASAFSDKVRAGGYDISAQTYKANCPPAALTKLPLTADRELADAFIACMDSILEGFQVSRD